jgi:hypothetical protein
VFDGEDSFDVSLKSQKTKELKKYLSLPSAVDSSLIGPSIQPTNLNLINVSAMQMFEMNTVY